MFLIDSFCSSLKKPLDELWIGEKYKHNTTIELNWLVQKMTMFSFMHKVFLRLRRSNNTSKIVVEI